MASKLLDVREVAGMLGTSPRFVWALRYSDRIPQPVTIGSRVVRWRERDISDWIEAGCPSREKFAAMRKVKAAG